MDRRRFLGSALGLLGVLLAMLVPGAAGRPPKRWKTASHWKRLAG